MRFGIDPADVLADPTLELHGPTGFTTVSNNNWRTTQQAAIQATGIPPTNDLESAILATLLPGQYTAIVKGNGGTTGIGLVEIYDLEQGDGKLANISTRAFVGLGARIVIAGFMLGNNAGDDNVIVRGLGPSLTAAGVTNVLANPTLELRNSDGTLQLSNNDWQDSASQAALITAAGLAPSNNLEAAIAASLPPGLYTVLLAGLNNTTGNGLVEVYDRGAAGGGPAPTPTPSPGGSPAPSPSPGGTPTPPPSPSPGISPPPASPTPTPPPPTSPTPTPPTGPCVENFDGPPPALPAGWTAELASGDPPTWETTLRTPDGGNGSNAFVNDQDGISEKRLDIAQYHGQFGLVGVEFPQQLPDGIRSAAGGGVLGWVCAGCVDRWRSDLERHNHSGRNLYLGMLHRGDNRDGEQPAGRETGVVRGLWRVHQHGDQSAGESEWANDQGALCHGNRRSVGAARGARGRSHHHQRLLSVRAREFSVKSFLTLLSASP